MKSIAKKMSVWAVVVVLILMIPLVAMQVSDEWNWDLFDYIFICTLLFGAALTYELVARKYNGAYRIAVGVAVLTAVLLVWINAAVGIIGDGPVNLMYFGVLAVGLIGALVARFRPRRMSRALFAMAVAQMLVPVIALVAFNPTPSFSPGVLKVFTLNAVFAILFVGICFALSTPKRPQQQCIRQRPDQCEESKEHGFSVRSCRF
jgi:peptidoglycan/LPS O-acetylase OafA/YrhL